MLCRQNSVKLKGGARKSARRPIVNSMLSYIGLIFTTSSIGVVTGIMMKATLTKLSMKLSRNTVRPMTTSVLSMFFGRLASSWRIRLLLLKLWKISANSVVVTRTRNITSAISAARLVILCSSWTESRLCVVVNSAVLIVLIVVVLAGAVTLVRTELSIVMISVSGGSKVVMTLLVLADLCLVPGTVGVSLGCC